MSSTASLFGEIRKGLLAVLALALLLPPDPSRAAATDTSFRGETLSWNVTGLSNLELDHCTEFEDTGDGQEWFHCYYVADFPDPLDDIYFENPREIAVDAHATLQQLYSPATLTTYDGVNQHTVGEDMSTCGECSAFGDPDPLCVDCKQELSAPGVFNTLTDFPAAVDINFRFTNHPSRREICIYIHPREHYYGPDRRFAGGPDEQEYTDFEGGDGPASCSAASAGGLPNYWVNTITLGLAVKDTDYSWRGLGPPVALSRTWDASSPPGMFGKGWRFAYESVIKSTGVVSGTAYVVRGSGRWQFFNYASSTVDTDGTLISTFAPADPGSGDRLTGYFGTSYYWLLEQRAGRLTFRYDLVTEGPSVSSYRLTSITDRNGNAVTVQYNADGTIAGVTDAAARTAAFSYDASGRCTALTAPNGDTASFLYDGEGSLVESTDLLGTVVSYTYDAGGYMTSMSAGGRTTAVTWGDIGGRQCVVAVTDAEGLTTSYAVDGSPGVVVTSPGGGQRRYAGGGGRTSTVVNELGGQTVYTYDANGRLASIRYPNWGVVSLQYDGEGNLTRQTGPTGGATQYVHDPDGNVTQIVDAAGGIWSYTYDARGNLASETTPLGRTKTWSHNGLGQLTGVTEAGGAQYQFGYDGYGNLAAATDPLGRTTAFAYDAYGLDPLSMTDPGGNTVTFLHDDNRRLTQVRFPDDDVIGFLYDCCAPVAVSNRGAITQIERDNQLRVTGITSPSGAARSFTYDDDGNRTSAKDPVDRTTAFGYDAAGRISSVTDPLAQQLSFNYDGLGDLTTFRNAGYLTTWLTYDASGRLDRVLDPLANYTADFERDAMGRVTSYTDARGNEFTMVYDADGRLASTTTSSYSWSPAGRLSSLSDEWGTTSIARNDAGLPTAVTYPDGKVLSIAYDAAGNIASLGYPGGVTVTYGFDSQNRPVSVGFAGRSVTVGYDARGNYSTESRSNGVTSSYSYNLDGLLTGLSHAKGGAAIVDLAYTRNSAGEIVSVSGTRPLAPFLSSGTTDAWYDEVDGVSTWGTDDYTYDLDGNLTTVTGQRPMSASYGWHNRLASLTLGGETVSHHYDALGNRYKTESGSATRIFHHDPWGRLLFETDGAGQVTARYVYLGRMFIAQQDGSGTFAFPLRDVNGSTLALAGESGQVTAAFAYSPLGRLLSKTGSGLTPFTYAGAWGVMDEGNGLYYMRNRHYDSVTGRFLQRDPIGFMGGDSNLYRYARSNPIGRVDPSGLKDFEFNDVNGYQTSTSGATFDPVTGQRQRNYMNAPASNINYADVRHDAWELTVGYAGISDEYEKALKNNSLAAGFDKFMGYAPGVSTYYGVTMGYDAVLRGETEEAFLRFMGAIPGYGTGFSIAADLTSLYIKMPPEHRLATSTLEDNPYSLTIDMCEPVSGPYKR